MEGASGLLDVCAGICHRYFSVDLGANGVSATADFDESKSQSWTDPAIGLRGQWNISEESFLAAKGDVGGLGVSSNLASNLEGTIGYLFPSNIFPEIGDQYLYTDYSDGVFKYNAA